MRSLRARLTVGIVTALAVVLAGGAALVARDADRSEREVVDDRLRRTAELSDVTALAAVERELPAVDARLNAVLRATGSSLRVSVGAATLLQAGVPLAADLRVPLGFATRRVDGRNIRVFTKTLRDDSLGGLARLQATTSLRQLEHRQSRLRKRLVAAAAAMLLVSGFAVWFAADLVLRPLRRLRVATAGIAGDEDLERRVPLEGTTETRALAGSFNAMLERLGRSARERNRALDATRRFAADAGHELRTPMTAIQATLSTIQRHPQMTEEQRAMLAGDALAEQRRLVELLDGLQALARGDANPVAHAEVDLAELVADAVQAAAGRPQQLTIVPVLPDGAVIVRGWAPGLRMMVDNLLDNAARHGRDGGTVRVTLDARGPVLFVDDDGPGVAVADRQRIFEPFARAGDGERPGSGLGLALVAQQAGHHGAVVTVDDAPAPLAGARFAVRFGG
jgi:signal transduction histidine kinase